MRQVCLIRDSSPGLQHDGCHWWNSNCFSSSPVFSWCYSIFMCIVLWIVVCSFVLFLLTFVFFDLQILITPLVSSSSFSMGLLSFGHCIVCPYLISGLRLSLRHVKTFRFAPVLSVLLLFLDSDHPFVIFLVVLLLLGCPLIVWFWSPFWYLQTFHLVFFYW